MYYLQLAVLCVTMVSVIGDLPPGTQRNTYLPPKPTPGGYKYPVPTVTFPTGSTQTFPPHTYPTRPTIPPRTPTYPTHPTFPTQGTYPTRPTTKTDYNGQPSINGNVIGHDHHHHEPGMPFDFNYAVKEDAFGNDYSHNAISDGDIVRGEYRVQLPDGRTQVVRYTADWQHGFSAQVSYDGTPRFDVPRPGGNFRGY
ncbi:PREDICTED: cuticle protein 19-like [Dinoponera quadriceps]|uniref:Cuticle protein 19-like n=1 Tax=Dinoponera quadriceps TaxID=609295 RepID=A0A6P3XG44_DINQU|nr:PREDICTED: cuticle protein 19-like [Dinoponera quadriceps]